MHENQAVGGQAQIRLSGIHSRLDLGVGVLKLVDIDDGAAQERGVAGIFDPDLAHHLADNDFDVLLVDVDALLAVHREDALGQVILNGFDAGDAQHVVRVERAVGDRIAVAHALAVFDLEADGIRHLVLLDLAVVRGHGDAAERGAVRIVDIHDAVDLRDLGHLLRLSGLEELFDTGKALRDIVAGNTAGVEGTHVAVLFFGEHLILAQGAVAGIGDDIGGKIQDLLQDSRADVENEAHVAVDGDDLVAVTAGHAEVGQASVGVQGLGRLGDVVVVLDVGRHGVCEIRQARARHPEGHRARRLRDRRLSLRALRLAPR